MIYRPQWWSDAFVTIERILSIYHFYCPAICNPLRAALPNATKTCPNEGKMETNNKPFTPSTHSRTEPPTTQVLLAVQLFSTACPNHDPPPSLSNTVTTAQMPWLPPYCSWKRGAVVQKSSIINILSGGFASCFLSLPYPFLPPQHGKM